MPLAELMARMHGRADDVVIDQPVRHFWHINISLKRNLLPKRTWPVIS